MNETPLTIGRASQIFNQVVDVYAEGTADYLDTYAEFKRAGAISRIEALNAVHIHLAHQFTCIAPGYSPALHQFKSYAVNAGNIRIGLIFDPELVDISPEAAHCESTESFVNYLISLNPKAPSYWSAVYARLNVEWPTPVPSPSPPQPSTTSKKPSKPNKFLAAFGFLFACGFVIALVLSLTQVIFDGDFRANPDWWKLGSDFLFVFLLVSGLSAVWILVLLLVNWIQQR